MFWGFVFMLIMTSVYFNNFHTLNLLLLLEVVMVMVSVAFCLMFGAHSTLVKSMLMFFTLVVCEAVLGMSVLIKSVRSYGSDLSSFI